MADVCFKTIGVLNCGGLGIAGMKQQFIAEEIIRSQIDICFLCETFQKSHVGHKLALAVPQNYFVRFVCRKDSTLEKKPKDKGGVAVIHREEYDCDLIDIDFRPKTFEWIVLTINFDHKDITIVGLYRPGGRRITPNFLTEFEAMLELLETRPNTIYVGDLNVHFEKLSNENTVQINEMLSRRNLINYVDCRSTQRHGGSLDVVICKSAFGVSNVSYIDDQLMFDHSFIKVKFHLRDDDDNYNNNNKQSMTRSNDSMFSRIPDKRKSLPIVSLRRVNATPGQQRAVNPKKPTNEAKRISLSSTLHNAPSYNNTSSFRTPCRRFSCPLNQTSSRSAPSTNKFRFASSHSTELNSSDEVDGMDSKTGIKFDHLGSSVRSNQSYTVLISAKGEEASDSVSDSGTYEVDEELLQRDDILKARRTISHVFGVRSSPKRGTAKPKRLVQFTRSVTSKQSPAKKATTGSAVVRPGSRIGSPSADANKSRLRCPVKGKSGQFGESNGRNSVETLGRSSPNIQSKKNSKVTTQKANSVLVGKGSRPNSRNSSIVQPFKPRLSDFRVSASDHVVNSSSGKAAVSCPDKQRASQVVTLRTNRTFELRCARLEASTASGRNADKSLLLLQKMRRRIPKLSADGTQETSSHTSICSRSSGNSSIYSCLRGLKQNVRQSSCSLLQEEVLSPVDSLTSVTIDGSQTSLDTAQAKKPYVRKTSSLLAYQAPRGREKDKASSVCSSKDLTYQERFALDLPEVRAWHERHRNDRSKTAPAKVVPGIRKPGQVTKKEEDKTNLLGNNSTITMASTCRNSFSVSQAKNGNKLNALKTLLRMSEEITAELRKMNENHTRGATVAPAQQQTVTNAMMSAFKNFLQMEKDIQEIGKLFKI